MPFFSWVELHGAITHLPLAFLLAVPVFEIGAAALRKPEWRIVSFWLLAAGVLLAIPALITGWITAGDLGFTGAGAHPPALFAWHRLAAFVTTGLAALLLFWRIRNGEGHTGVAGSGQVRSGQARPTSTALAVLAALTALTTGFLGGRMVFGAGRGAGFAPLPAPSAAPAVPGASPQLVATGAKLFQTLPCLSCHRMQGKGGISGPDLTHEATRHSAMDWHIRHLKDPHEMNSDSGMPPFDSLTDPQLKALAAYLATRH